MPLSYLIILSFYDYIEGNADNILFSGNNLKLTLKEPGSLVQTRNQIISNGKSKGVEI